MSDTFTFTYSPKQREEIEAIRQKYTDATENKMDELRRIDARVTSRATVCSVAIGIAGVTAVSFGVTTILNGTTTRSASPCVPLACA